MPRQQAKQLLPGSLVQVVSVFKLDNQSFSPQKPKAAPLVRRAAPAPLAPAKQVSPPKKASISHNSPPRPAAKPMAIASNTSKAGGGGEGDWESF